MSSLKDLDKTRLVSNELFSPNNLDSIELRGDKPIFNKKGPVVWRGYVRYTKGNRRGTVNLSASSHEELMKLLTKELNG